MRTPKPIAWGHLLLAAAATTLAARMAPGIMGVVPVAAGLVYAALAVGALRARPHAALGADLVCFGIAAFGIFALASPSFDALFGGEAPPPPPVLVAADGSVIVAPPSALPAAEAAQAAADSSRALDAWLLVLVTAGAWALLTAQAVARRRDRV